MPASIFETCARWLLETAEDGWQVCHGFVLGDWSDECFSHCWLENSESNTVLDLSRKQRPTIVDAGLYTDIAFAYALEAFSKEQLQQLVSATGHFGPYDNDLIPLRQRTLH